MENVQQACGSDSAPAQPWAKGGEGCSSGAPGPLFLPPSHVPVRVVCWPRHLSQFVRPRFAGARLFGAANCRALPAVVPFFPCGQLTGAPPPADAATADCPAPDGALLNYERPPEQGDAPLDAPSSGERAQQRLTELAQEHEELTEREGNVSEECAALSVDEREQESIACALNDIAYEIEVETNNETELINEVLSENYTEENEDSEKITFNTIEEVLTAIDESKQRQEYSLPFELTGEASRLNIKMGPGVQEEVVKAAKSLFSKRTRTLYHWLYPDTSKTKLKATVTTAWDTLPENEKHFYMSQVLGRFGLQAGNLMINPQLDGIKGFSAESSTNSLSEKDTQQKINIDDDLETDQAVDDLLASCGDTDGWLDYEATSNENIRKRKRDDTGLSQLSSTHVKDGNHFYNSIAKQMKEVSRNDFEDDTELNNELMKFQIFNDFESITSNNSYLWTQSSETALFDHLEV